ncbi:MAG: ArsR/SmtB family transcription factor [Terriglobales bacterium]|jgi:DNA-binding transcriptional ArsR family regulator
MSREFAQTAALLSDRGRAEMLVSLIGGTALPAGELATIANVAPQTASSHLSKLIAGKLLRVEQQGRHRYYRLADDGVASVIEALLAVSTDRNDVSSSYARKRGSLGYARTCYSHLAGHVAVKIAAALQVRGFLLPTEPRAYTVTRTGTLWFARLGITMPDNQKHDPRFARRCLDWTERRHHVAGRLGSTMIARFRELKWIATIRDSRAVRVTPEGERKLQQLLGLS